MYSKDEIKVLLDELNDCVADDLENQSIDFKQWNNKSKNKAFDTLVEMAVCMANGGGGSVVFGVADGVKGRENAIIGVSPEIDPNILKRIVYERTDPKITPDFEVLNVPEGTGRLLVMQILSGIPPYTDTQGKGKIRRGKDCVPLTGTIRGNISIETGEADFTAETVARVDPKYLSSIALEVLRDQARKELAPSDLLNLTDIDLLTTLGLIRRNKLTRAAILLVGNEEAIMQFAPGNNWTFLQMVSDTKYINREDRVSALPIYIQRIEELLVPFNPITTYEEGLYHFEYRTWPETALREALMNSYSHTDLRIAGQY